MGELIAPTHNSGDIMSRQQFPTWVDQPGSCFSVARVTGANVSAAGQSTAGLDGRGANFCTIARVANAYTVTFLVGYADAPYVKFTAVTSNVAIDAPVVTATGMTFNTVQRDANGTPVNTPDFVFEVTHFNTINFVS